MSNLAEFLLQMWTLESLRALDCRTVVQQHHLNKKEKNKEGLLRGKPLSLMTDSLAELFHIAVPRGDTIVEVVSGISTGFGSSNCLVLTSPKRRGKYQPANENQEAFASVYTQCNQHKIP